MTVVETASLEDLAEPAVYGDDRNLLDGELLQPAYRFLPERSPSERGGHLSCRGEHPDPGDTWRLWRASQRCNKGCPAFRDQEGFLAEPLQRAPPVEMTVEIRFVLDQRSDGFPILRFRCPGGYVHSQDHSELNRENARLPFANLQGIRPGKLSVLHRFYSTVIIREQALHAPASWRTASTRQHYISVGCRTPDLQLSRTFLNNGGIPGFGG